MRESSPFGDLHLLLVKLLHTNKFWREKPEESQTVRKEESLVFFRGNLLRTVRSQFASPE